VTTEGIEGVLVETHNWGKTVAFWKALGYELEFETDHHSGQLRHPRGGPFVFVAERPEGTELAIKLSFGARDAATFTPPTSGRVVRGFEKQHWGALEMVIADPDGRQVGVHAPLPSQNDKKK
jgi:hypothetical protein